jgi:hypothetical protein
MTDPFAGWRALTSLLRPGGFMKLGFYSEVARRDIVKARGIIAEGTGSATASQIRQARQELMTRSKEFSSVTGTTDFFSTSMCRDLLFHVQEHRMRLADIGIFLKENGFSFLGFELPNHDAVLAAYRRRFAEDPAAVNLSHWQDFETENPALFVGMYVFWVQKAD